MSRCFVFAIVIAACGSPSPSPSADAGPTVGGSGMNGGDVSIVSLTSTPAVLAENQAITISAIVTDKDGLSAIAGGRLVDAMGTSYGAFTTAGGQGTFSLALTWSGAQAIAPIDEPAGGGTRALTVEFFDNQGRTASLPFTLAFACPSAADSICSGTCADLATDPDHCGTCGDALETATGATCDGGTISCPSSEESVCGHGCYFTQGDVHHCGDCQTDCTTENLDTCDLGKCAAEVWAHEDKGATCTQICENLGFTGCDSYRKGEAFSCGSGLLSCDDSIAAVTGCSQFYVNCWCTR